MQTPWNQNGLNLKTWIARELASLVSLNSIQRARGRASSMVHHLFLSTVTRFPELWSIRRDYYTHATQELIEIWKRLRRDGGGDLIAFACPPDEVVALIHHLEVAFPAGGLLLHLARLKYLLGLGEVEIAEIMDLPERSVRRQLALLSKEFLQSH